MTAPTEGERLCAAFGPERHDPQGVRCRHHRRRPQRPDVRGLSRGQGSARHRAGEECRGGRRCRHGGVPSGLSQLGRGVHGEPAQPHGHPRPRSRGPRPRHRRAHRRPTSGRWTSAALSSCPTASPAGSARVAVFSAERRRAAPGLRGGAGARGGLPARAGARAASQRRRRPPGARQGRRPRPQAPRRLAGGQAAAARPLHQERRRLSRAVVRERGGQGRAGLRWHRRRLRQSLDARHGLPSAALRLRRGERQAGVWGHAIGGMGAITQAMARAAVARGAAFAPTPRSLAVLVEGERAAGVELQSGERIRARAVAANVPPKLLLRDLVPEARSPPSCAGASSPSSRAPRCSA